MDPQLYISINNYKKTYLDRNLNKKTKEEIATLSGVSVHQMQPVLSHRHDPFYSQSSQEKISI